MQGIRAFGAAFLVCICSGTTLLAQGWTQNRGEAYVKVGVNVLRSDTFNEKDGNVITIPTLSDYTFSLYGEYGITDWLTGVAYVPVLKRLTLNRQVGEPSGFVYFEGDEVTGPADAEAGVRVRLLKSGGTIVTGGVMLGIPIGDDDQENGLYTGDGEFNQLVTAGVAHSFYPTPLYASLFSGLNNRSGGYSDELRYGAEAGYTIGGKLTAIVRLLGLNSLKNGDDGRTGGTGGLFANDQSYLTYGVEGAYQISERLGVSLGVTSAFFGRNTLSAPEFSGGVFLKL